MKVHHNKFINAHHIKILQINILKTWLDILLFLHDKMNLVHIRYSQGFPYFSLVPQVLGYLPKDTLRKAQEDTIRLKPLASRSQSYPTLSQ